MPPTAWIGLIGTLALFVLSHIGITIWWASKTNTLLDIVQRDLSELISELKGIKNSFVDKADLSRELAIAEKEHRAIWKNIDELKERVNQ